MAKAKAATAAPKAKAKAAAAEPAKTKLSASELKNLARAIELGLEPKVKAALAKNPDLNVVVKGKYSSSTPLLDASMRENANVVKLLLDAGADPNLTTENTNRTSLHCARTAEVTKLLLAAGANPNPGKNKHTPLHAANQDPERTQALLEGGAEVDAKDNEGKTPYVTSTNLKVRQILKKFGSKGLPSNAGREMKPKKKSIKPTEVEVKGSSLGVDAAGNVWTSMYGGIVRYDGKEAVRFEFQESFAVDTITAGPNGLVYFSTNWGLVTFANDKWRLYSSEDSDIHDPHVTEMFVDRMGRAHCLGYGGEEKVDRPVSVFDPKKSTFTTLTAGDGLPPKLEISCLAFDEKNQVFFGTPKGVLSKDGKSFWAPKGSSSILSSVRLVEIDKAGMWIGLWQGVHHVDGKGKLVAFHKTDDGVKCMLRDDAGTLWVGLSYGGLLRVDAKGERQLFREGESGLPADDVEALALGKDGTIWIACGGQLAVTKHGVIKKFDGLAVDASEAAKTKAKPKAAAEVEVEEEAPSEKPQKKAKPKKKKLEPLPAKPFVAKPPKQVVDALKNAVKKAKLESIDADTLLRFVRPAIAITIGKATKDSAKVGASKLGGRPDLAKGMEWPNYPDDDDRKLPFLLQINLADVAKYDVEGLLPKKGRIAFFAETAPDELTSSQVVFCDAMKKSERCAWPEDLVDRKSQTDFVAQLPEHELAFRQTWTLPSNEYLARFIELSDADQSAIQKLAGAIEGKDPSATRLLGWPISLQEDLTSSPDTLVLLQLDASMAAPKTGKAIDQVFRQWGNGMVHFFVGAADLKKGRLGSAEGMLAYT